MRHSRILVEHEADHGEKYPTTSAGFRFFIVSNKATIINEPSERSFNNPAPRQNIKTRFVSDAFYDFNDTSRAFLFHPVSKFRATEASVGPYLFEFELAEHGGEKLLGSTSFGCVSRKNGNAQNPAKNVDANKAFASLGLFSSIITNLAAMRVGAYSLAVNGAGTWGRIPANKTTQRSAQTSIDRFQQVRAAPCTKVVVNCFPRRKILWQHPPRTTTFQNIKNSIKYSSQTGSWSAASSSRGK